MIFQSQIFFVIVFGWTLNFEYLVFSSPMLYMSIKVLNQGCNSLNMFFFTGFVWGDCNLSMLSIFALSIFQMILVLVFVFVQKIRSYYYLHSYLLLTKIQILFIFVLSNQEGQISFIVGQCENEWYSCSYSTKHLNLNIICICIRSQELYSLAFGPST